MSKVIKLFPAPLSFEVCKEQGFWFIYSIYSDGKATDWQGSPDERVAYLSLYDAVEFLEMSGIDKFKVSLGQ